MKSKDDSKMAYQITLYDDSVPPEVRERPSLIEVVGRRLQEVDRHLPPHLCPSVPTVYTLELIAECNHKCIGCGNVFSRHLEFLGVEAWERIIERLKPNIYSVRITGGECTLHPDFAQIIRCVDDLGVPFVIFTNGRWVNPDATIELFASCDNLDGLLISLHGKDAHSYRAFVVTDSFDIVVKNIRQATEAGIRVETNTILLRSNHEDLEEIAELGFSLGAQSVAFSRYYGNPLPGLQLTKSELKQAMQKISEMRNRDERIVFNNCVPMCFTDINIPTKGCTSGFTHCTIDPCGNVRPCTHAPVVLGNIFEQSIEEIWQSETLQLWREFIPSECYDCALFDGCRGGCRATAYLLGVSKDPLIRGPIKRKPTTEPVRIRLFEGAKPVWNCAMKEDNEGYFLINRSRHVLVSQRAEPLLKAVDRGSTLYQIQERFGNVGLNFVGTLYKMGLLAFE